MELCWLTCVSSELNGGELTRSGGVDALGRLLQRCLDVLPRDASPTLPATVISTHCLRTFAGMASFADARHQLAERWVPPSVTDIVHTDLHSMSSYTAICMQRPPSSSQCAFSCSCLLLLIFARYMQIISLIM